jgi:hypothetical protein
MLANWRVRLVRWCSAWRVAADCFDDLAIDTLVALAVGLTATGDGRGPDVIAR